MVVQTPENKTKGLWVFRILTKDDEYSKSGVTIWCKSLQETER